MAAAQGSGTDFMAIRTGEGAQRLVRAQGQASWPCSQVRKGAARPPPGTLLRSLTPQPHFNPKHILTRGLQPISYAVNSIHPSTA